MKPYPVNNHLHLDKESTPARTAPPTFRFSNLVAQTGTLKQRLSSKRTREGDSGPESTTATIKVGVSNMRIPSLQLSSGLLALQGVLISSTRAIPDEHGVVAEPDRAPLHPHSTCADVLRWTPSRQEPAIVLQVVSKSFVYVQENFLILMEERSCFTRENLYLMCLDDDARATMADEGIPCVPIHRVKSLRQLWNLRVHTLGCLLAGGWNVFLSDSDALWLSDPIVDMALAGVNEIDIVTQRGGYPYKQNDEWGVTMCMGFALFRSRDREGGSPIINVTGREGMQRGEEGLPRDTVGY